MKNGIVLASCFALACFVMALGGCKSKANLTPVKETGVIVTKPDYEYCYQRWKELFGQDQYDEAMVFLKKAADGNQVKALNDIAFHLSEGSVYNHNIKMAERYARKGAELGDMNCQRRLGMILRDTNKEQEALEWMVRSAEQGQGSAAYMAAEMYENGEGTKVNKERAIHWYRIAAKQTTYFSSNEAKEALERLHIQIYEDDEYMTMVEKELKYCEGSAEDMYREGKYWKYDFEPEQLANLIKSAEKGYPFAQMELATIYSSLDAKLYGIDKEDCSDSLSVKAYDGFVKLAKAGDVKAFYELGGMYYRGYSFLEKNLKLAEHCFRKGAETGHDACQLWLGIVLRETNREKEALEWFVKAGNQNQGWAAYLAGEMYEKGEGTSKNMEKAIKWYTVSAKTTNKYASDAKSALKRLGQPVPEVRWF